MSRDGKWPRLSRRSLLAGAGAGGIGAALALGAQGAWNDLEPGRAEHGSPTDTVPFYGSHQAGIGTPAQQGIEFAAFDVVAERRQDVAELMRSWSHAAARLCAGRTVGPVTDNLLVPPPDTGEAQGSPVANLTVTFGFGPSLFESDGLDRFGIAAARPAALVELPTFPGDQLDPSRGGGDIAVQACADDPIVAFHAIHDLTRMGRGLVTLRWAQSGFSRTSSTSRSQTTPRNLMGFKDGTDNVRGEDHAAMASAVWVGGEGPAWMERGSYLVARRIRILLEVWDRSTLDEQQQTIGRHKLSGAPLSGIAEFDPPDLAAVDQAGHLLIPADAHIRLAAPADNSGARLLRRGYSFFDGVDELGELDAGLFFLCYQRDPRRQFVPIQRRLASTDALNRYVRPTSSSVFACPPGAPAGGWVGQRLLES